MNSAELKKRAGTVLKPAVVVFLLVLIAAIVFAFARRTDSQPDFDRVEQKTQKKNNSSIQTEIEVDKNTQAEESRSSQKSELLRLERSQILKDVTSADVMLRNKTLNDFKQRLVLMESADPELKELLLFLRDVSGDDDAFAPLVAAAAAVGTPAVQAVLLNLLQEKSRDWRTFSAIVPVLGGLSAPSGETLEMLTRLAREGEGDFSATAALALGASVHTMAETQPVRAGKILDQYIGKIQSPQTDIEDLKEALAVLGNAGLNSTAGAIVELTFHPRADVRSEAVMALRFVRTSEVELRLVKILETDPDTEIRLRAADALVHAPLAEGVRKVAQRMIEAGALHPQVLREKCIDLLLHLEFSEQEKGRMRDWALYQAEAEKDSRVKAKLLRAAEEFSRR